MTVQIRQLFSVIQTNMAKKDMSLYIRKKTVVFMILYMCGQKVTRNKNGEMRWAN